MANDFSSDFCFLHGLRVVVRVLAYVALAIAGLSICGWGIFKIYPQSSNFFSAEIEPSSDIAFRVPSISFRDFMEGITSKSAGAPESGIESRDPVRTYIYPKDDAIEETISLLSIGGPISANATSKTTSHSTPKARGNTELPLLIQKVVVSANELAHALEQLPPDIEELARFLEESFLALPNIADRDLKKEFLNGLARELTRWRERVTLGDDTLVKDASWYNFPTWYVNEFSRLLDEQLSKVELANNTITIQDKLTKLVRSPNILLALSGIALASYLFLTLISLFLAVPLRIEQLLTSISQTLIKIDQKASTSSTSIESKNLSDWTVGDDLPPR